MSLLDTLLPQSGPQFDNGAFTIDYLANPLTQAVQGINYTNGNGAAHIVLLDNGIVTLEQDIDANTSDKYLVINLGSIGSNGIVRSNFSERVGWSRN